MLWVIRQTRHHHSPDRLFQCRGLAVANDWSPTVLPEYWTLYYSTKSERCWTCIEWVLLILWLQVDYTTFMCRCRTRPGRLHYIHSLLSSHCTLTDLPSSGPDETGAYDMGWLQVTLAQKLQVALDVVVQVIQVILCDCRWHWRTCWQWYIWQGVTVYRWCCTGAHSVTEHGSSAHTRLSPDNNWCWNTKRISYI